MTVFCLLKQGGIRLLLLLKILFFFAKQCTVLCKTMHNVLETFAPAKKILQKEVSTLDLRFSESNRAETQIYVLWK